MVNKTIYESAGKVILESGNTGKMTTKEECVQAYQTGKDILYRVMPSGKKRFGGWRSMRKRNASMYPWEMVLSPYIQEVEWKIQ